MNRTAVLFCCLAGLAALAACGGRIGAPLVPYSSFSAQSRADGPFPNAAHAPCTFLSSLKAPIAGTPKIAIAYGQLMMAKNRRFAYSGMAFIYKAGKYVYAATAGRATYYAKQGSMGPVIVVKSNTGIETLYSGFARPVHSLIGHTIKVKAGQTIAVAGSLYLHFEYAPTGNVLQAGTQANPCGSGASNGASGTIGVMPSSIAVEARFHALSLDATPLPPGPYPSGSPDVSTPEGLTATSVVVAHTVAATVYERSDVFSSYYVVLCGNVVFATGHARYAGPFTYNSSASTIPVVTPSLPPLVFFRDAGAQGKSLTAPLPAPYSQACPAPNPASTYTFNAPVFDWTGQTMWGVYWYYNATPSPAPTSTPTPPNDTVAFSSSNTSVITVTPSPSPLPVSSTAPPFWPIPAPRADFVTHGVGNATITVTDSSCTCTNPPINVTVNATPSPAPIPTPIPNT